MSLVSATTLLPSSFFLPAPDEVARNLLGRLLVRRIGPERPDGERLVGRIVETEAYFGQDDPAAHSAAGNTARTSVLFGPPGHAYVYFIYGMHSCLNVSCEPDGRAGCVLIRALEPLAGLPEMARNRGLSPDAAPRTLASGPGRLCQALGINRAEHKGMDPTAAASDMKLADDGFEPEEIVATTRIGITKAADRPHRYLIADNKYVSVKARPLAP
ncbi:MAG: DNA-3-methyladenine glycosylase [Acidobacteriaceae bacterium]